MGFISACSVITSNQIIVIRIDRGCIDFSCVLKFLNKSAPVGILPLMQVQIIPRTPCAHCQHEAGSLLLQVILYFLGQEPLLPNLQDKVVIFFDPGTSPASTTSATDRPCTSRLCNTRFFLTLLVCKVTCRSLTRARFDI